MCVRGYGPIVEDIHSLEPLDLTEHLLLFRDGIFPVDVLGIKGSYLGYVSAWDNLKRRNINPSILDLAFDATRPIPYIPLK